MIIHGQRFYNMIDGAKVIFTASEVALVTTEGVVIEQIDYDTEEIVAQEALFMVCVVLMDGRLVATEPHHDQDFVETIGNKLADICSKAQSAKWH